MKRALSLILVIFFIFTLSSPVFAQFKDLGALNITTSPLPISLSVKPGESIKTNLRVKNSGNKTEVLKVGLMKFSAYGDAGKPRLDDRSAGDDYFDWVSFSKNVFTAEPNVWQDISMTINVPKTAAFGYYYAVTFQRANPANANDTKTTVLLGGTSTLVLLDVYSPNARRELKIDEFKVSRRSYEFLPVEFTVKLKNTGNIHVAPVGSIYITRGSSKVEVLPFNSTKGNILPNSGRIYTQQWSSGFPVYEPSIVNNTTLLKDGQTVYRLNWKFNHFTDLRFGRYTAHITVVYDDGVKDQALDASVSFWVIPWRLIGVFIGIPLVMIITIIYLVVSRRKYKKRSQNAQTSN